MYFPPNGNINILRFVPLDNTYTNTIFFETREEQIAYFTEKAKLLFTKQTYTRYDENKIRIEQNTENLLDCNYIMFQNKDFGEQWYYAFVKSIKYINNYTSEIEFELDVMQTWMWNYNLGNCLVIREHSLTDEIGDNLVTENINIGDLVPASCLGITGIFDKYSLLIFVSEDDDENPAFHYVSGLPLGARYITADVSDSSQIEAVKEALKKLTEDNKIDSIINMVVMPTYFMSPNEELKTYTHRVYKPSSINGYIPKNNKLFTYPYNFLSVNCGNNTVNYRYEFFDDPKIDNCVFELKATTNCVPQIALTPKNYMKMPNNYNQELIMEGFPQIGYAIDSFKAWLAQNGTGSAISFIGNAVSMVGGVLASGTTGGVSLLATVQGVTGLAQQINSVVVESTKPAQSRGNNTGSIDVARRAKNFYFSQMQVQKEFAEIIDNYFTMYGYACNKIKIPNIGTRPHYNYVKLDNINFKWYIQPKGTSVPAECMNKIINIYKNGITFWKKDTEVGDYSVDNRP